MESFINLFQGFLNENKTRLANKTLNDLISKFQFHLANNIHIFTQQVNQTINQSKIIIIDQYYLI